MPDAAESAAADRLAELARRAELFQGLFDHMQAGVAIYRAVDDGSDFVFTEFNPAAERIEGTRREEVLGRRVSEVFPGVRSLGLFQVFQRVWRTGKPEQHPVARYQDDRLLGWRLNIVFRLPSGEVAAIYTDETERRRLELEREHLIAELKTRNHELERFTYTVSHDLKSPLITIQGFVGLLAQDLAEQNSEAAAADLERISRAAKTMQKLLEDLLELSRAGRFAGPLARVPLGEVVSEALDLVAGRISARGVRVTVAPDLPVVLGDRMRLTQLLQNLLDNAVKFMDDQKKPEVHVGMRRDGGETVFFVRDNGRGIEPIYHQRIFDLFNRLDGSGEGTGVGLTLARRVAELHGGRLWVESAGAGRGSCFCFTLPGPTGKDGAA
jgi:PAS domain S-box-containing protein